MIIRPSRVPHALAASTNSWPRMEMIAMHNPRELWDPADGHGQKHVHQSDLKRPHGTAKWSCI